MLIHGDCIEALQNKKITAFDAVITSPPYNISRGWGDEYDRKYNEYSDNRTNEEYMQWQVELFVEMEKKLSPNGVVLYNINYGGENTDTMWILLGKIISETNFTIADQIIWKKKSAIPNNVSKNALTRICENIFVFVRKNEIDTFDTNKKVLSISKKKQKIYETFYNYIETKNNDQGKHTEVHKATFSVSLVERLLDMYVPKGKTVYDPFMGSGTTGVACKSLDRLFIGTEIDSLYFKLAEERISKHVVQMRLMDFF